MTLALAVVRDWYCPNCGLRSQTRKPLHHREFHACRRLGGVMAPLLVVGTKAKVERLERQDYLNGDRVQVDENGRPVMSVQTTRDEGTDLLVFAPVATGVG
jgi:transposase